MIARTALRRISSTTKLLNRNIVPTTQFLVNIVQFHVPREVQKGLNFSTSSILRCEANDIQKQVDQLVKKSTVVVFMKGVPAAPRCGFSNAVCQIFRMHDVTFESIDVLQDEDIRQGTVASDCLH